MFASFATLAELGASPDAAARQKIHNPLKVQLAEKKAGRCHATSSAKVEEMGRVARGDRMELTVCS